MNIMNTIKAIVILNLDGRRTLAKYYDDKINAKQFERGLFTKTKSQKNSNDIIVLDGVLVVHKLIIDSHVYVVGSRNENPLVLDSVLNCIIGVINSFQSNSTNSNVVVENLSQVILALDEICDGGLILENDYNLVLQRISPSAQESNETMTSLGRRLFGNFGV